MKKMMAGWVVMAGLAMTAVPMMSAQSQAPIAPASAGTDATPGVVYTNEELIPLTVHQAWLKSGKDEAKFFDMVTQLAELSAKNRHLQLPESAEAGRKTGEMIKVMAKKDTDQLLFAVVDAAVRKVGTPVAATASN